MTEFDAPTVTQKSEWEKPELEHLGCLGDVEGGAGLNAEGGLPGS